MPLPPAAAALSHVLPASASRRCARGLLTVFLRPCSQRARDYLASIPGGVGAYSESKGAVILRKEVAKVGLPRQAGGSCGRAGGSAQWS